MLVKYVPLLRPHIEHVSLYDSSSSASIISVVAVPIEPQAMGCSKGLSVMGRGKDVEVFVSDISSAFISTLLISMPSTDVLAPSRLRWVS